MSLEGRKNGHKKVTGDRWLIMEDLSVEVTFELRRSQICGSGGEISFLSFRIYKKFKTTYFVA
jgi:hypothetical protein